MVSIEPGNRAGPPGSLTGPLRDIVVIGASRGGVEALRGIVAALPPNLQSTLLIVLHTSPTHASLLPDVLSRAGHFRPSTQEMACALSAATFTWRLRTIT
jgi:chemotaxis response regulator CheB